MLWCWFWTFLSKSITIPVQSPWSTKAENVSKVFHRYALTSPANIVIITVTRPYPAFDYDSYSCQNGNNENYSKNPQSTKAANVSKAFHRYALNYINALNYLETLRRQQEFSDFEKVFMFSLWFFAKLDEHWASRCLVFLRTWYPHYIIMMWSFAVVKQIFENLSWTMVNLILIVIVWSGVTNIWKHVMNHGEYSCNRDRVQWYNKYLKICLWSI